MAENSEQEDREKFEKWRNERYGDMYLRSTIGAMAKPDAELAWLAGREELRASVEKEMASFARAEVVRELKVWELFADDQDQLVIQKALIKRIAELSRE